MTTHVPEGAAQPQRRVRLVGRFFDPTFRTMPAQRASHETLGASPHAVDPTSPPPGGGTARSLRRDALLALRRTLPTGRLLVKSGGDLVAALLGLVLLLPLLVAIAIAVRLTSPGPAFFRQERVGRAGKSFQIWKFRTMCVGADCELQNLLRLHGRDDVPLFKVPGDPRVTPLGRFLRRTSLDELPQLINVLLGQMALVGPRPQRPAEVALYSPEEAARLRMKPGLTGLWQVSGRSALSWAEAVQHDLTYIREWSLRLDAKILLKTIVVVVRRTGAE